MTQKGYMSDFYKQFEEVNKKLDKANNTTSKSSYADNLSSLLMDGENAKAAMDFVEKYKIKTDNAISNYILLNNSGQATKNYNSGYLSSSSRHIRPL